MKDEKTGRPVSCMLQTRRVMATPMGAGSVRGSSRAGSFNLQFDSDAHFGESLKTTAFNSRFRALETPISTLGECR